MPEEQPTLTPLQKAQLAAEAVEGTWYFDEYLYRGEPNDQPGGQYKGSHVVVGIRYTDQFGDAQTKLFPPMPVGDMPEAVPLGAIFPEAAVAMQRTLDAQTTTIAEHVATIAAHVATMAEQNATIEALNAKLAAVAAAIA